MEKNKRNKIIGLSIGILVVLIIVVSSTYAYWQITRTQETPNDIVAACLSLDLQDKIAAIDLDSAWPISDEEANNLTGYTFTVINNCNEEINYIVGLNRVEEDNYLQDTSVKVRLDDNSSHVYGELSDVDYVDHENTYTSRVAKQVSVESISANGSNEHTIRVWVNDEAPVTEQSKTFLGQVFIIGGQGIEVPNLNDCFTIASNGTILGYDFSCGTDVKIPAEINGVKVKRIDRTSFTKWDGFTMELVDKQTSQHIGAAYIKNQDIKNNFISFLCGGEICDLEQNGAIIFNSIDEYNQFEWDNYTIGYISPEKYREVEKDFTNVLQLFELRSIDLSDAVYLETIATEALNGVYYGPEVINDTCEWREVDSKYHCDGNLAEVKLPLKGMLTRIEDGAFCDNIISTKIVIPNTVTYIGYDAFARNNITEVIIKNSESNITVEDSAFSGNNVNIVYNPNYTE